MVVLLDRGRHLRICGNVGGMACSRRGEKVQRKIIVHVKNGCGPGPILSGGGEGQHVVPAQVSQRFLTNSGVHGIARISARRERSAIMRVGPSAESKAESPAPESTATLAIPAARLA